MRSFFSLCDTSCELPRPLPLWLSKSCTVCVRWWDLYGRPVTAIGPLSTFSLSVLSLDYNTCSWSFSPLQAGPQHKGRCSGHSTKQPVFLPWDCASSMELVVSVVAFRNYFSPAASLCEADEDCWHLTTGKGFPLDNQQVFLQHMPFSGLVDL